MASTSLTSPAALVSGTKVMSSHGGPVSSPGKARRTRATSPAHVSGGTASVSAQPVAPFRRLSLKRRHPTRVLPVSLSNARLAYLTRPSVPTA